MIKHTSHSFIILCLLFLGFGLFSCESTEREPEIVKVAQHLKTNQCKIQEIASSVDSSWDKTMQKLAKYLPDDLPEEERKLILIQKNASLIRHFDSYDSFDPKGHQIVDSMENLDMKWAERLRNLSKMNQDLEMQMDSLFSQIENPETIEKLTKEVDKIRATECMD